MATYTYHGRILCAHCGRDTVTEWTCRECGYTQTPPTAAWQQIELNEVIYQWWQTRNSGQQTAEEGLT